MGNSVTGENVFLDELGHFLSSDSRVGFSFYLFREIVDGQNDELVPVGRGWSDFPDDVDAPG